MGWFSGVPCLITEGYWPAKTWVFCRIQFRPCIWSTKNPSWVKDSYVSCCCDVETHGPWNHQTCCVCSSFARPGSLNALDSSKMSWRLKGHSTGVGIPGLSCQHMPTHRDVWSGANITRVQQAIEQIASTKDWRDQRGSRRSDLAETEIPCSEWL